MIKILACVAAVIGIFLLIVGGTLAWSGMPFEGGVCLTGAVFAALAAWDGSKRV